MKRFSSYSVLQGCNHQAHSFLRYEIRHRTMECMLAISFVGGRSLLFSSLVRARPDAVVQGLHQQLRADRGDARQGACAGRQERCCLDTIDRHSCRACCQGPQAGAPAAVAAAADRCCARNQQRVVPPHVFADIGAVRAAQGHSAAIAIDAAGTGAAARRVREAVAGDHPACWIAASQVNGDAHPVAVAVVSGPDGRVLCAEAPRASR